MSGVTLRGKCREYAEDAVRVDPTLSLVRGWYYEPTWGKEEHWWCERPDGTIFDPTAQQFPMGGVFEWYEKFDGLYPCQQCGAETPESELVEGRCCSDRCFMRMVGL